MFFREENAMPTKKKEVVESSVETVKKAPAAKAKAEKAETVKKTVKKAVKKTAKAAEPQCKVFVEFAGRQVAAKEVLDKAVEAYRAAHEGAEVSTVELYVKPEENAAYYVVNGEADPEFKVEL